MVLETTLDEDSGLEVLWASLESLLTGVKGDPEVPNTGKYPVVWLEWRAGEEWRRELPGERKGELRSSADLRSSWIWFWSCCSCWRWADCSAAEWISAGLAAPENNEDDEPWRNTIKYNCHLPLLTSSSKQDDWCFHHRLSKMNRRNLLNSKGEKHEDGILIPPDYGPYLKAWSHQSPVKLKQSWVTHTMVSLETGLPLYLSQPSCVGTKMVFCTQLWSVWSALSYWRCMGWSNGDFRIIFQRCFW